nr:4-amino-4-deoxy-L-arabinose transferase [Bacillus pacificus]
GSSETNSVLELAFGYNGISRLTGNQGVPGAKEHQQSPPNNMWGMPNDGAENGKQEVPADKGIPTANDQSQPLEGKIEVIQKDNNQFGANLPQENGENSQGFQINKGDGPPTGKNGGPDGMAGGMFGTGEKGPFRLFQS